MKRIHALSAAVLLATSLSALAGPDWTVIERARSAAKYQNCEHADLASSRPRPPAIGEHTSR